PAFDGPAGGPGVGVVHVEAVVAELGKVAFEQRDVLALGAVLEGAVERRRPVQQDAAVGVDAVDGFAAGDDGALAGEPGDGARGFGGHGGGVAVAEGAVHGLGLGERGPGDVDGGGRGGNTGGVGR